MFEASRLLFIVVETPLHAGTGRGLGAVDLPIQRERTTDYPMVQASSIKGRLRAEAYQSSAFLLKKDGYKTREVSDIKAAGKITDEQEIARQAEISARRKAAKELGLEAVFGPETDEAEKHAGALAAGDARLLLFPVRSLAGVMAWVTSAHALARFKREAAMVQAAVTWPDVPNPDDNTAWVNGTRLVAGGRVVLEEFSFEPNQQQAGALQSIGEWLTKHALPQTADYAYWRTTLPSRLCVLPEEAFRDFVLHATEVQTHVRLNLATKTVEEGALWTSESLPVDTVLYAPLMATASRTDDVKLDAKQVLGKLDDLKLNRTHLGGDETTGQGMVALTFVGGKA